MRSGVALDTLDLELADEEDEHVFFVGFVFKVVEVLVYISVFGSHEELGEAVLDKGFLFIREVQAPAVHGDAHDAVEIALDKGRHLALSVRVKGRKTPATLSDRRRENWSSSSFRTYRSLRHHPSGLPRR